MASSRKNWTPVLIILIVLLIAWFAWRHFDVSARIHIAQAVSDVMEGHRFDQARKDLENLDRRKLVIDSLKGALKDDNDNVWGKWRVLQLLSDFGETRVMARALDSEIPSTRRAAARFYEHQERHRDRVVEIALEWLGDESAASRDLAVRLVQSLDVKEAVPDLEKMFASPARTQDEVRTQMTALSALATLGGAGGGSRALKIAADAEAHVHLRNAALSVLSRASEAPPEGTRELAIGILTDRAAAPMLRAGASNVLMRKDLGGKATWDALKQVVVDPQETDRAVQRAALYALAPTCPLDGLAAFLTQREVYTHPYPFIRSDVAAALAALNYRKPLTLDILESFLVDQDAEDAKHEVRREAWLSFYQLTGVAHGVKETSLFPRRPAKPITDEAEIRAKLWYKAWMRAGAISQAQAAAVERIVGDLEQMKAIRQTYADARNAFLEAWEKE